MMRASTAAAVRSRIGAAFGVTTRRAEPCGRSPLGSTRRSRGRWVASAERACAAGEWGTATPECAPRAYRAAYRAPISWAAEYSGGAPAAAKMAAR
jgi:hypothetical protein